MSNNRMYLVNTRTNEKILLAKYYPSTGWYMFHSQEKIDDFFDQTRSQESAPPFGDAHFQIKYETVIKDEFSDKAKAEEL